MAKEKGTYSLISVDVAPDEEVVRVDAQGVHQEQPRKSAGRAEASSVPDPSQRKSQPSRAKKEGVPAQNAKRREAESESYDGRDDLEGPVPMAGLQRGIIAVVVVCLVAFIAYFVVSHG